MRQQTSEADFHGAIGGRTGIYESKIYPLCEKVQIYFAKAGTDVYIAPERGEDAVAGVYYVEEYEEYCVEPYEKNSFFLLSGQPLGAGRCYHLPRGIEVYIGDKCHAFVLA